MNRNLVLVCFQKIKVNFIFKPEFPENELITWMNAAKKDKSKSNKNLFHSTSFKVNISTSVLIKYLIDI